MGRAADRFGVMVPVIFGTGHAQRRLCRHRLRHQHAGLRHHLRRADRPARQLRPVRPAGRRYLALVQPAAGARGLALRQRQLLRRRLLAAGAAALHRDGGLAADPYRHRHRLPGDHAAAGAGAAPPPAASRPPAPAPLPGGRQRGTFGLQPECLPGAADVRRRLLLRRHGHAAGPYRRLLRRPRLRRGAGGGDALAHARLRRGQPPRLRLDPRPHRQPRHPADGRLPAGRGAGAVPALRRAGLALCRLRRSSACSRAASCRATPSSCGSPSPRAGRLPRRAGALLHPDRHGASAAGCRAPSSMPPAPTRPRSSTASAWNAADHGHRPLAHPARPAAAEQGFGAPRGRPIWQP